VLDKIDNMNTQTRVVIATILSLLVFVAYDALFMPKTAPMAENNASLHTAAPATNASKHAAPAQTAAATGGAPVEREGAQSHAPGKTSADTGLNATVATVETSNTTIEFDALGRIRQVYLKDSQYRTEEGNLLKLFNNPKIPKPLEIRFTDARLNELAFKTPCTVSARHIKVDGKPATLTFTQNLDGFVLKKEVTFYPDHHYDVKVTMSEAKPWFISTGYRPDIRIDNYTVHGAMIEEADGTLTIINDGDAKGNEAFRKARIAVAFDRYYATALFDFEKGLDVVVNRDAEENPILFLKEGSADRTLHGYIGPKEYKILKQIHPELTKIIEFGWFTFIAAPMFKVLMRKAIYRSESLFAEA